MNLARSFLMGGLVLVGVYLLVSNLTGTRSLLNTTFGGFNTTFRTLQGR